MTGMFLPLARLGKQFFHAMPARGGQRIFDAPDFLQHLVAAKTWLRIACCFIHTILHSVHPACRSPAVHILAIEQPGATGLGSRRWRCADNSTSAIYPFCEQ